MVWERNLGLTKPQHPLIDREQEMHLFTDQNKEYFAFFLFLVCIATQMEMEPNSNFAINLSKI